MNVLSELSRQGKARRLAKGVYALGERAGRRLEPTPAMRRVARALAAALPALEPVLSSTRQVAHLMHNLPTREIVLVQTTRASGRDVVQALAAAGMTAAVVSSRADMERLLDLPGQTPVVVLPVGDARASEPFAGVRIARPERVLVDLAVERDRVGLPMYAEDVVEVGRHLLADYDFSVSRALDYARRRRAYDRTASLLRDLIADDPRLRAYAEALP